MIHWLKESVQLLTPLSTGATGYIGGNVLNKVIELYGNLEITALLREPSKAFADRYPQVKVVKGTFHDFDVIEKASQEADIIIRTSKALP